ncbi:MAG: hypothetical protein KF802_12275 [Bdellovibrionaceae bacterium]|nr:hypothetical protein [Pseudobdellovibrionaceae bacterium]
MKSRGLLIHTLLSAGLLGFAAPALAQETLSVKAWAKDVQSSVQDKARLSRLLDLTRVESESIVRPVADEKSAMLKARTLFEQRKYDAAIAQYNRIPKSSDSWLEAVEEKGWSYLRKDDVQGALAQTKTLLSPAFRAVVGSEPFFLQSLAHLKICDYKGSLETLTTFSESQKARIDDIQKLAASGHNEALQNVIDKADAFPLSFHDVGENAKTLPRLFYRDVSVQKYILRIKMAEAGVPVIQEALASSKDRLLQTILLRLEKNAANARELLRDRMKKLAQNETNENFRMVQKLNLIKVEVTQRVHTDQGLDKNSFARGRFNEAGEDDLIFADDGRPWIDELDKYQVKVNSCPQNIRRKM